LQPEELKLIKTRIEVMLSEETTNTVDRTLDEAYCKEVDTFCNNLPEEFLSHFHSIYHTIESTFGNCALASNTSVAKSFYWGYLIGKEIAQNEEFAKLFAEHPAQDVSHEG